MEATSSTTNVGQLLGALVIGTAIGGVLGILFAPAKGSDTRKKIATQSDDLTNNMKEKFNDFLEELKAEASIISDKAKVVMQDGTLKATHR